MPVHAMNHFTVLSDDLDRTTAFYERILGLRIGERPPLGFPGAWMYAGEQAVLSAGTTLTFGVPEHRYTLTSTAPPQLMALPDRGEPVFADCELLCLPAPESCELTIFRDCDDRWVVESDTGKRTIEDQEHVTTGGRVWRICLPSPIAQTRDAIL